MHRISLYSYWVWDSLLHLASSSCVDVFPSQVKGDVGQWKVVLTCHFRSKHQHFAVVSRFANCRIACIRITIEPYPDKRLLFSCGTRKFLIHISEVDCFHIRSNKKARPIAVSGFDGELKVLKEIIISHWIEIIWCQDNMIQNVNLEKLAGLLDISGYFFVWFWWR